MSGRQLVMAGNWKMNFLREDARAFCVDLVSGLDQALAGTKVEVVLFPPALLIDTVARSLGGHQGVRFGGQDVHHHASGAFTGDLSAMQLAEAGCTWVLCGHSERRRDHGESDDLVGNKAKAAREGGLIPMICLGETLEERRAGRTFEVLQRQLEGALAGQPSAFELAYEPVWAIGTGETATPEIAQEAHAFLRQELRQRLGNVRADATRILYGGSAKPENVDSLLAGKDIDGFLVGGASLDAKKFLAMIATCASYSR